MASHPVQLFCGKLAVGQRFGRNGGELRFVDVRAAQEPRFAVGMVLDDLQQQRVALAAVARDAEKKTVRVIELRAVEVALRELFHFRRKEIVALEHRHDFVELRPEAAGIQIGVEQDFHG